MKASLLFIIVDLLISSWSTARPLPLDVAEQIRNLTLDGLNRAYNFDIAQANKIFDQAAEIEPLHPRPYVGKAMIVFWRFLLNREEKDKDEFFALADQAIDAAEKFEDKYGEDADVKLCLGMIYGYRSFVHGRARSYFKSAWDGKQSYDYFYDAIKLDPRSYDAYLGIGIFHYFVAFIPKPLQWIISVIGVTGDSESGIREIRVAAQRGTYTRTEARYYLAQFLPWQDGDFAGSEKILADLTTEYPSNTLMRFTLAAWQIRRRDVNAAMEKLATIAEAPDGELAGVKTYALYKLAECYFRLGRSGAARTTYQAFLQRHKERTYVSTSNFRIGLCFDLAGLRDSAALYYGSAAKGDRRFGDDAYSARRAELFLIRPFSTPDSLLLAAQNAQKSGNNERALGLFTTLKQTPGLAADLIGEITFGSGETLFERQSYAEALPLFREIVDMNIDRELWLKPWSHYYAGLSCTKLGMLSEARKEFDEVLEFDEYDFRNWLEFRSKRELEKPGR